MNRDSAVRPPAATPSPPVMVVGVFDDQVRARQALEALQVWRRANPRLGVGPIGLAGRHHSGATTYRTRGVLRPRRGARWGLLTGLILLALPAAGAAGLVGWLFGTIVFGLTGLVGITPGSQSGSMAIIAGLASAFLAALVAGVLGAIAGCLVGLLVGLIDDTARGPSRSDTGVILSSLPPGSWATLARSQPPAAPLVRDELARLGAAPTYEGLPALKELPPSPSGPAVAAAPRGQDGATSREAPPVAAATTPQDDTASREAPEATAATAPRER